MSRQNDAHGNVHKSGRFYYNANFGRVVLTKWVLGLDIGLRKTGVAVGQSLTRSATPLAILQKPADSLQISDIRGWVTEWRVQAVIIGRPMLADGTTHPLDPAIDRIHIIFYALALFHLFQRVFKI